MRPETRSAIVTAFTGQHVAQVCFDGGVTIVGDAEDCLHIATDFALVTPSGEILRVAADAARPVEALVGLLQQAVTAVRVTEDGMLTVSFDDGWRIEVAADELAEAWELEVKGGHHFACAESGAVREVVRVPRTRHDRATRRRQLAALTTEGPDRTPTWRRWLHLP